MADYTKGTGSGGIMLIRDQGYNVEFHIQAGQSATYVGQLRWQRYLNGGWSGLLGPVTYNSGRPWVHLDTFAVTYNQTIYFRLEATGTQGLGGATEFPQWIQRATVPPPPTPISLTEVGHTTFRYQFGWAGDGGSAVLEYQIGYGTSPSQVQYYTAGPANGIAIIGGLTLGETWYIWVRARNAVGWSGFSTRLSARTLAGSRIKVAGTWREAVAMIKVAGVWRQAIPFIKSAGVWKDGK